MSFSKFTLILDIDETLLSVKRCIDEIKVLYKVLYQHSLCSVIGMTKRVLIEFLDNSHEILSKDITLCKNNDSNIYLNDIELGDIIYVDGRSAKITSIQTLNITLLNETNNSTTTLNCNTSSFNINDDLVFIEQNKKVNNNLPELIYKNIYFINVRPGLIDLVYSLFYGKLSNHYNVILWTAATRSVYTDLICEIENFLIKQMTKKYPDFQNNKYPDFENNKSCLFQHILFRDNCTFLDSGHYFKDITKLKNIDLTKMIIVDNREMNFSGYENNLLPILDYYGHSKNHAYDKELFILNSILLDICTLHYDIDISFGILHSIALEYGFSLDKLNGMIGFQEIFCADDDDEDDEFEFDDHDAMIHMDDNSSSNINIKFDESCYLSSPLSSQQNCDSNSDSIAMNQSLNYYLSGLI